MAGVFSLVDPDTWGFSNAATTEMKLGLIGCSDELGLFIARLALSRVSFASDSNYPYELVDCPMRCRDLATRIEAAKPDADAMEIARLCLLALNFADDETVLASDEGLETLLRDATLRLHAATDQHSAMTGELERLASSDPKQFDRDQIWVLLRAIKVQSQILQMYMGGEVIDV